MFQTLCTTYIISWNVIVTELIEHGYFDVSLTVFTCWRLIVWSPILAPFLGGGILPSRIKGVIGKGWELFSWIITSLILPNVKAYIWSYLWSYILVEWKLLTTCILPLALLILIQREQFFLGKKNTSHNMSPIHVHVYESKHDVHLEIIYHSITSIQVKLVLANESRKNNI